MSSLEANPPKHPVRVRCYADGLNVYYGVAVPYNFKWIDLEALLLALVRELEPQAEIEKVFLFTSRFIGGARERQDNYFNALKHHSRGKLEVVLGYFTDKITKRAAVVSDCCAGQVKSFKLREEKCTDVNLACQMVQDAYTAVGEDGDFDVACLVSNDADMSAAVKIKMGLQQKTFLITPVTTTKGPAKANTELTKYIPRANRISSIPKKLVLKHPLPDEVGEHSPPDSGGWSIKDARRKWAVNLIKRARKARAARFKKARTARLKARKEG